MTTPTPAQVLERRRQLVLDQDIEGFVGLFAPDGVIEVPFAGPDLPARLEGQAAIRAFSARIAAPFRIDDFETVALYQTSDPEVVITEVVVRATITATGKPFTAPSIQLFRIRDGRIALFRDYTPGPPAG